MNVRAEPVRPPFHVASVNDGPEPPIRSILFREAELGRLGRALAGGALATTPRPQGASFARRTAANAAEIARVVRGTEKARSRNEQVTPAATWLIDNHYMVQDAVRQIRRDLPRAFVRQLPPMTLQDGTRPPRALAIAWAYVAHTDSHATETGFEAIVKGFQEVEPLRIGELWALPSLLRFVLVENLARMARRVQHARDMRTSANALADRVLATADGEALEALAAHRDKARDVTFATQLLFRLRDGSRNADRALHWLETELERAGSDAEDTTMREHARLSAGNVTVANIIGSLKRIDDIDWTLWFEGLSHVDALLRERSDFGALDFASRNQYREAVELLAKRSGLDEVAVAERAVTLAAAARGEGDTDPVDAGAWLVGPKRPDFERELGCTAPVGERLHRLYRRLSWLGIALPVAMVTALLVAAAATVLDWTTLSNSAIAVLVGLFVLPASEAALGLFNTLAGLLVRPEKLVGYEFRSGLPQEARTLVVVPTLIGSRDDVEESVRNLEVHYLANTDPEIFFALLSDWPDSAVEQTDADMELVALARTRIAELNRRYPPSPAAPRFHILHRRRLYSDAEGVWMGWERKRGKLHELNQHLRGDPDVTFLPEEVPLPPAIRFVMTLDADTRTTRDAVKRLAGKLCHPLNRPQRDARSGRVVAGHGILQPRVTPSLTTGDEASFFQRAFSSHRGMDPYVFAVSDVYQDVFGSGSFTGKGLYEVDAFEGALAGRIPENAVLSHDLLEGAYAGAGLASDVELVEDYPTRYSVDASRQHRWARGDWQLLPFVLGPLSGVPALSRWKMLDNLRRTLLPIAWVAASIAGWSMLPLGSAALWQVALLLSLFFAPTFEVLRSMMRGNRDASLRGHVRTFAIEFVAATAQVALKIAFIAHSAWSMGDAIVRTLWRMFVSRRHLLEWRTASQVAKTRSGIAGMFVSMYGAVVVAVAAVALPFAAGSPAWPLALPFGLVWAFSPLIAWFVSRTEVSEERLDIDPDSAAELRAVARRTWRYFETFVTDEHNDLPPDNFQEIPAAVVAGRTSPTNIGMYLLSVVCARDFGWISMADAVARAERTLATLGRMERFRGHFLNWYDTRSLDPLHPRYVSSVDSGNLAGHLIALSAAFRGWAEAPAAHLQGDFTGLLDVTGILQESLADLPDDRRALRPIRHRLNDRLNGMAKAVRTIRDEPETAAVRIISLSIMAAEIRRLAAALHQETGTTRSRILLDWADVLAQTCSAHTADAHMDEAGVAALRTRLETAAELARRIAFEMDFRFLLRKDRNLLSIGYRVDADQLDEACYDLLASEARLTSLFGIAKGDLPTEHWFRLGRPLTVIAFRGALLSWSGSMFEFLMPPLVMKEPQGGILNQTSNLVIRRQIAYARSQGVPWGISEAAYNARDREMTYQYTNFGVPGLGLKGGLSRNLVISPYSSLLAAQFKPAESLANLRELRRLGALGAYGYYDAVDFTPERVPGGQGGAVVRNYMAHHQGMSIVAVGNAILDGRMRDRFHSDPVIEAAELLLQEKAPRQIAVTAMRGDDLDPKDMGGEEVADHSIIRDPAAAPLATSLLSNGRYHVMLTATGTGYSRWDRVALTRWAGDAVEDRSGTFLFIRDTETGQRWSATAMPPSAQQEQVRTVFADDKATFAKTVGSLHSEVEVIVAGECDGEARRLTFVNNGRGERLVEITSFAELALAPEAADDAHPAFSRMFVKTAIAEGGRRILAERRRRGDDEPRAALCHFVTAETGAIRSVSAETDRRAFIGRGRSLDDAAAFDQSGPLGGAEGFTLDPVAAIRCQVRVPAGKKVVLTFWTVAAEDTDAAEALAARFDHSGAFERQAMLAWTRSQVQTRHCGLSPAEAARVQRIGRHLLFADPALREAPEAIASGLGSQRDLWPCGISGDHPIFVLRVADIADLDTVAAALRYQEYLRGRGLVFDFVIVNEQAASYAQELQHAIDLLSENHRLRGSEHGPRQHIFAIRRDLVDTATYRTLLSAARIAIHARSGTIFDQLERAEALSVQRAQPLPAIAFERREQPPATAAEPDGAGLEFWNGYGGFAETGRDYVVRLTGRTSTPHPWINVIANPGFGFHSSAEGTSFTWSRNSRDFQLTPWSNDPVADRPGEAIYIANIETGETLSPIAAVLRDAGTVYEATHSAGCSTFSAERAGLRAELAQLVDPQDPIKLSRLTIRNEGGRTVSLRVYAYAEWVLGNSRKRSAAQIVPGFHAGLGMLTARNPFSLEYADRCAFLAGDAADVTVTADRREFLGSGDVRRPQAVTEARKLSGTVEAGRDPCAALARDVSLAPGESVEMVFLLGDAGSPEEAAALVERHRAGRFDDRLAENRRRWDDFAGALTVKTPDPSFDHMVNRWLPYQALACRITARSAFYQASGAYGFRDQLQDTLALLLHDPSLARAQILNAAARQFREGDVQHWWLPRTGAGVRTTISDDVAWLAHAVAHYVEVTGDAAILTEQVPFLEGPALEAGRHDAFFEPKVSGETGTVLEHCARALDLAMRRTGPNGLPLILGGDWNDGMNRVGEKGIGESVWLGWFLARALADFAPLAEAAGEKPRARKWRDHAAKLKAALESAGWDGGWYRRGFYDDGAPLGSAASDECRIDSIAQSWAVLSGVGDPARASQALDAAWDQLVDHDAGIARLFTPPFESTDKDPGYIRSYPPGVRENGGQYTHAATWLVMALAHSGRAGQAGMLYAMLNPVNHARDRQAADRYRVEPYVVAADIYSGPDRTGRGGWTWYTGSAGWMYRVAVEAILGIRRKSDRLEVRPCLPPEWSGYECVLRFGGATYHIEVRRADAGAGFAEIAIAPEGEHRVLVEVAPITAG
jgi:cyclic beta-1,2-glucan synthetase